MKKMIVLGIEPSPSHMHTNSSNQLSRRPRLVVEKFIYTLFSASPLHLIFSPAGSLSHSTSKPMAPSSAPSQSSTLPPPLSRSSSSSLGSSLMAGLRGAGCVAATAPEVWGTKVRSLASIIPPSVLPKFWAPSLGQIHKNTAAPLLPVSHTA
jgi:hypothetical protein